MTSLRDILRDSQDRRRRGRGAVGLATLLELMSAGLALTVACSAGEEQRQHQTPEQPVAADSQEAKGAAADDGVVATLASARSAGGAANASLPANAEEPTPFFCYVEILTADRPSEYGYLAPRGCMPSGTFVRGERMVFRFEVMDLATGKRVTAREAATITLRLPYRVEVEAEYKQRGEGRVPDAPWTWDVCWDVPLDYPLGTLDYSIAIALKEGRQGLWKPPALVDPSRGIDTRPQIIE